MITFIRVRLSLGVDRVLPSREFMMQDGFHPCAVGLRLEKGRLKVKDTTVVYISI